MNYYWWKDAQGKVGNVYAKNEEEAKDNVKRGFGNEVSVVELIKEDVDINRFTGKSFGEK